MSDAAATPPPSGEPVPSGEPRMAGTGLPSADPDPSGVSPPASEPAPYQPGWMPPAVPSASFIAPAPHDPPPQGAGLATGPYAPADAVAPVGPRYTGPPDLRHPLDPDVRPSTKASAVLFLGVVAVSMMLCVGGVVPAILALALARSARAELRASQGFLTGEKMVRAGIVLSWIAIAVSSVLVISAVVYLLIRFGADSGPSFGTNVN
ncbi:MAG: hypothetical protein JWO79_4361 [Actinomycetia bacterium]|nr:hypothetical protein [Actinomycetes bacterium]